MTLTPDERGGAQERGCESIQKVARVTEDFEFMEVDVSVSCDCRHETEMTVGVPNGLHMRPAAEVAKVAREQFPDTSLTLTLSKNNQSADCRSIIDILALGVEQGDRIILGAKGPKAKEACAAVAASIVRMQETEEGSQTASAALREEVVVEIPNGLHMRPALTIVKIAKEKYPETIVTISNGADSAKCGDMLQLMLLNVVGGGKIVLAATGPQAKEAFEEIRAILTCPEDKW